MSKFAVTLSDGTKFTDLELNGNNFMSSTEIKAEMFKGKLTSVLIEGDKEADEAGLIGRHHNMELVQVAHYTQETHGIKDGWYFILRDIPEAEIEKIKMQSDIAYLSMMSGIDVD